MTLADIVLRPARRDDAPILAAMSRDLIETGLGWHYRPEVVAKFVADPETVSVVACDRRRVVGFAIAQVFDDHEHVVLLAVQPSHRQRGIGRQMTEWAVATAATAGVASVHVELRAGNRPAYALYRTSGFAETLRLEGYYSGRETAIRMMRLLRAPVAETVVWHPPARGRQDAP
jgi:ribosomal-protein-alanine N-acetyltransferase